MATCGLESVPGVTTMLYLVLPVTLNHEVLMVVPKLAAPEAEIYVG